MHDPLQESLVLHLFLGSCCMSEIEYCLIMFDWSTKQSGFFLSLIDKWKKIISIIIFGREKRNKYKKIIFYQNGISRDTSTRGSPRLRMHWQLQGCPQISHNFIASANFSQFYCLCKFDKLRVIRNPFNLCTQPFNFTKLWRNEQWTRNPMSPN